MEPSFPLSIPPACLECGRPCTRDITISNRNGNAGRPFYTCKNHGYKSRFSCFDDSRGISSGNPPCRCRFTSRKTRSDQRYFFSCPVGRCRWFGDAPVEPDDNGGNPFSHDLPVQRYQPVAYEPNDLDIFNERHLQYVRLEDFMPRIQAFVEQPGWKSKVYQDRDEKWHSQVARLMMQAWEDNYQDWKDTLRRMPLLPVCPAALQSSTLEDPCVFFPEIDGILIPQDIIFPMILPAAAANPDCRKLYETLGVTAADPKTVRKRIISKHRSWKENGLNVAMSSSHLRYLYQMRPRDRIDGEEQDVIVVFDHKERAKHPMREYVYLPGEDTWSPDKLLQPFQTADTQKPDVSFIHPAYLQDPPSPPTGFAETWIDWLRNRIRVETKVQIFTRRAGESDEAKAFSEEFLFAAKHWPSKVISRFHEHWQTPELRNRWEADECGTNLVRELELLCEGDARHPLQRTFLPLPSLLARCESLLVDVDTIPFLKLGSPLKDGDSDDWSSFGKHFGIGVTDNLNFSLAILRAIINGNSKAKAPLTETVPKLYLRIHAQCLGSESRGDAQKNVREFFAEHCGVFRSPLPPKVPCRGNSTNPDWACPIKCLWDAPARMSTMVPLKPLWEPVTGTLGLQDRENLEQFFRRTLLIGDMTGEDILKELDYLVAPREDGPASSPELECIHEMYRRLDGLRKGMDESKSRAIKAMFEEKLLIYAPSDQPKRWFKVSECIWSSGGGILGKTCLQPLYPDLAGLFVEYLGVPELSFALVYQELVEIGSSTATISHVKDLLWLLKAFLPSDIKTSPAFANGLASCRIFPVKMPDGSIQTLTARDGFVIIDGQRYANALKSKVKILDFTLAEVRHLRPLIQWAGLTDRYLSRSVVEQTIVDDKGCIEDAHLTRDLALKAGAFVSIAAHFDSPLVSPAPEAMHSTFRSTRVLVTDTITSTLIVVQDGKETTLSRGKSELHIQAASDGRFEIYVPANEGARDFCVASRLPRELAAYLLKCKPSSVSPDVVSVVASILHAKPTSAGRILEANGIIELDLQPHVDISYEPILNQGGMAMPRPSKPLTPDATPERPMNGRLSHFGFAVEATCSPLLFQQKRNEQYRELLVQAVKVTQSTPFPDQNSAFNMSALLQTLQGGPASQKSFTFFIGDPAEYQRMVEAAGELFAFELLAALRPRLPDFGHSNWQSTVRHYVKAHPAYSTLEPWSDAGPSDIFYSDESGVLTTVFIEKGYLDETWRGEKPDYYIQVETTVSNDFETPFYLSKYQYSLMQSSSRGGAHLLHQKKKAYVLFRVYGLESGHVGVKLYVDPERARKDGQLEFEADGWVITPKAMRPGAAADFNLEPECREIR